MQRSADALGNAGLFMRSVEEEGLRKFLLINMPTFHASTDVTDTCRAYTKAVDQAGLYDGSDTSFRGDDQTVQAEIGERCVYRRVCAMRHDEGLPVHCIRAFALAEMLRIRLEADFDWKLTSFGVPCRITLSRRRWR